MKNFVRGSINEPLSTEKEELPEPNVMVTTNQPKSNEWLAGNEVVCGAITRPYNKYTNTIDFDFN